MAPCILPYIDSMTALPGSYAIMKYHSCRRGCHWRAVAGRHERQHSGNRTRSAGMQQSLRSFWKTVESGHPEQLRRVCAPVEPVYDATAMVMALEKDPDCPILWLERVVGSEMPLVANVLATKGRLALAMGVSE